MRQQCQGAPYREPSDDVVPLDVSFTTRLGEIFGPVPKEVCILLDGAPLFPAQSEGSIRDRLQNGDTAGFSTHIARSGVHRLDILADYEGSGDARGYRFDVNSMHRFTVTGAAGGQVAVEVRERPVQEIEMRPTLEWAEHGELVNVKP
jgi:hypothetical protein